MTDKAMPRSGMPVALPAAARNLETVQLSNGSPATSRRPGVGLIAVIALLALAVFAQAATARTLKFRYSPSKPTVGKTVTFRTHASCGRLTPCRYVWQDDGSDGPHGKQWPLGTGRVLHFTFKGAGTKRVRLKVYNRRGRLRHQYRRIVKVRAPSSAGSTTPAPAPAPAPAPTTFACTATASSIAAVQAAVAAAKGGEVICLPDGAFGRLDLSGSKAGLVVVGAQHPGATTVSGVTIGGANLGVANLVVNGGGVHLNNGAQHIVVSHNRIVGAGNGIEAASTDPSVPNNPCPSCQAYPPFVDVTIDGNVIDHPATDALYLGNFNGMVITNNEITGVSETGDHSDCLQVVFGGRNITFQGNYEHDNFCQGFFIKDGDVTGARFLDNLFIKGQGSGDMTNVTNTSGFVVQHNTIWDGKGFALRHEGSGPAGDAIVDHNVIDSFAELDGGGWQLSEDYDLFGAVTGISTGAHTTRSSNPPFANPAAGDYRLTDGSGRGVTWAVGSKHFGP